jgi:hypothetical protein
MRDRRAVVHFATRFPARHAARMDAQFARQLGVGGAALLDIATGTRRGGGIGVQFEVNWARRSINRSTACTKPIPSRQSSGTKHLRRGRADEPQLKDATVNGTTTRLTTSCELTSTTSSKPTITRDGSRHPKASSSSAEPGQNSQPDYPKSSPSNAGTNT